MINFYCPDFYLGKNFYMDMVYYMKHYPEYFNEKSNIKYIFGAFPNMIWNGGGVFMGKFISPVEMEEIKSFYEELNIPLQLTMTNTLISTEHLEDKYCNTVLEIMSNGKNEILVSSPVLEDYIRKYYPEYKINRSVINISQNIDNYNNFLEKYNKIVIPHKFSKEIEKLKIINLENRNRVEIICNDPCSASCPKHNEHYDIQNNITLGYKSMSEIKEALFCKNNSVNKSLLNYDFSNKINYQDIINDYLPLGFTEFKLTGRGNLIPILTSFTDYFVKEEYKLIFFQKMLLKFDLVKSNLLI